MDWTCLDGLWHVGLDLKAFLDPVARDLISMFPARNRLATLAAICRGIGHTQYEYSLGETAAPLVNMSFYIETDDGN